jgi:hypothetical protein
MNESPQKRNHLIWLIIIVVIIVAFVVYAVTLGKVNYVSGDGLDALAEKRRLAQERHDALEKIVEEKQALKKKLDRKFKIIYIWASVFCTIAFFGIHAALYFYWKVTLETILTLNTIIWGSYAVINLLLLQSKFPITSWVKYARILIENKVYAGNLGIGAEIEKHKTEVVQLKEVIGEGNNQKLPPSSFGDNATLN